MATVAALQRLIAGAHYLSDILVSIPLTLLVALAWAFLPERESSTAYEEKTGPLMNTHER
jgi:membrane-associated phospholipid phosphatase